VGPSVPPVAAPEVLQLKQLVVRRHRRVLHGARRGALHGGAAPRAQARRRRRPRPAFAGTRPSRLAAPRRRSAKTDAYSHVHGRSFFGAGNTLQCALLDHLRLDRLLVLVLIGADAWK
jgi:hypothetical protein